VAQFYPQENLRVSDDEERMWEGTTEFGRVLKLRNGLLLDASKLNPNRRLHHFNDSRRK
jgi:hypothetical protein